MHQLPLMVCLNARKRWVFSAWNRLGHRRQFRHEKRHETNMSDKTINANRQTPSGTEVVSARTEQSSPAGLTPKVKQSVPLPLWLARPLSSLALRACPITRELEACKACHVRVLCKCAQAEFSTASAVERRVWLVLAAVGGASVLYAAWLFLAR